MSTVNPLSKKRYRNVPCPCGSSRKYKFCCMTLESTYVEPKEIPSKKMNLVSLNASAIDKYKRNLAKKPCPPKRK